MCVCVYIYIYIYFNFETSARYFLARYNRGKYNFGVLRENKSFSQLNSSDELVIIVLFFTARVLYSPFRSRENSEWCSCVANEATSAPSETI